MGRVIWKFISFALIILVSADLSFAGVLGEDRKAKREKEMQ